MIYLSLSIFLPGFPNLGAQIRCTQNRYIVVQTELKYPLNLELFPTFEKISSS